MDGCELGASDGCEDGCMLTDGAADGCMLTDGDEDGCKDGITLGILDG